MRRNDRRSTAADLRRIFIRQLQIFGLTLGNPDEFSGLIEWCSDGRLLPLIDARYPLGQICAAFSHLEKEEGGERGGKVKRGGVGCAVRESSDRDMIDVGCVLVVPICGTRTISRAMRP